MKFNSLSLRLLVAASISVVLALLATGIAFSYFFKTYFEDRVRSELTTHLQQLTANIEIDSQGQFLISPLSDQRFDQPFSGLYWQIDPTGKKPLHSRSLWDLSLELQRPETLGMLESQRVKTLNLDLMVLSWVVIISGDQNPSELMLSVATDAGQIRVTADKFNKNLGLWLSLLAAALIFAAWLQVRVGLRPLENVRAEIGKIRDGSLLRMPEDQPREVAPLVGEVNALLANQQETLEKARSHAGDLAHGLKTPLTIMRALAQQIRDGKTTGLADQIDEQTQTMANFVDRELARSRSGNEMGAKTDILPIVTKMVSAISKLPAAREIEWKVDIPAGLSAPFDAFNLSEILGNLLDNAREWTHDSVIISAVKTKGGTSISISDNGPGVAEDQLLSVLQRGKRIDNTRPGNGLGLAIVQDLVGQHDGKLTLKNRPNGGLVAIISWG